MDTARPLRVTILAGGFGGARMAQGFAQLGKLVDTTIIGNTGDDLELFGLHISPDLDTVMYTLAGLANDETGWGVRNETWSAAEMLARYGKETWFRIGDRDLATHVARTAHLLAGERLTVVTRNLAKALGVTARLLPMSDEPIRTKLRTSAGWLDFQDYFVRRGHRDEVTDVRFDGLEQAHPTPEALAAVQSADLVVVAPSNPFVSVAPILALPELRGAIRTTKAPVVAVSPIVGGAALRGPAAAMMQTLAGADASAVNVAQLYATRYPGLLDVFVLDRADAAAAPDVERLGLRTLVTSTVIATETARRRLAQEILDFAGAALSAQ